MPLADIDLDIQRRDVTKEKTLVKAPSMPAPSSLTAVADEIRRCLKVETDAGHTISNEQDPASFTRMGSGIKKALGSYALNNPGDWKGYASWNEHHYIRHLIDGEEGSFELILICWAPSQKSRIHNHAQSHCFLSCVSGQIEETQYLIKKDMFSGGVQSLVNQGSNLMKVGDVGYINDFQCLHSVGCPEGVPAPGSVTLHCYCPPITEVTLYEPADDSGLVSPRGGAVKVSTRRPGFFTVRGERT